MGANVDLIALIAGLHLLWMMLAGVLFLLFIRSDTARPAAPPGEGEDDGGGSDRARPRPPEGPSGGGLPLPHSVPARTRLRGRERLADSHPRGPRRPHHPAPPRRVPARNS